MKLRQILCVFLGGLILIGVVQHVNVANAQQHPQLDPSLLIKAKEAYKLMNKKDNPPIVIDVRSRVEYDQEHIFKSESFPYNFLIRTKMIPFAKDRMIIAYCGCPHHLSGLSAEHLKKLGYKSVKVIDEGFLGWKEQGLPTSKGKKQSTEPSEQKMSMGVRGQLLDQDRKPVSQKDIFLSHEPTGQLEATRTDANGHFEMHVHFTKVGMDDNLSFKFEDKIIRQFMVKELKDQNIVLTIENKKSWIARIWSKIMGVFEGLFA